MSKTLLAVGLAVAAVVGLGTVALPALRDLRASDTAMIPTFDVERGDFVRRVYAEGNLKAVDATVLGPPPDVSQPLKIAWLAPDGAPVSEGDVVIRFDPSEMEQNLRDGKHDRAATDSRIDQRKVREEGSRKSMLLDSELASLEVSYAKEFQSKDQEIFSRTAIIESEIDQELAGKKKAHAERSTAVHSSLAQAELDLLGIERRKAELKIEQAEKGLQGLEVRAPHDGIFVLKKVWGRKPEVGQVVWGGNAVAELPKLDNMEAQVYVLEADAGGLEVDQQATVTIDAHPGFSYEARVKKVDALAQRRNRRVPVQYFGVTLEIAESDVERMKPGQRVQSVIRLDELEDAMTVPRQAVFEEDGKKVVYVRRGGDFEPVEVELGPAALGRVVIEKGLEAGDRIALRDPTRPVGEPQDENNGGSGPVGAAG